MLLRIFLCGLSLYFLTRPTGMRDVEKWVLAGLVLLFNPIAPVELGSKPLWSIINIATVVWFWMLNQPHCCGALVVEREREREASAFLFCLPLTILLTPIRRVEDPAERVSTNAATIRVAVPRGSADSVVASCRHNGRAGDFPLDEVSSQFIGRRLVSHRHDVRVHQVFSRFVFCSSPSSPGFGCLVGASGLPHICSLGWQPTMCYPLAVHWCGPPWCVRKTLRVRLAMEAKATDLVWTIQELLAAA